MPLVRPTRQQLLESARTEIEARLPGADARLRHSLLDVYARCLSALVHSLYGYLEYHIRQPFPQLADSEWLRRHAELYGVAELPPEFSRGNVTITGTSGTIVLQDTSLRRLDGREYITSAQVEIAAGTAVVPVIAVVAGADGNAAEGVALRFTSSQAGVNTAATIAAGGLAGGTDPETEESLRSRILSRIQRPPAGGTISDYQRQAKLYPDTTDVFVHPQQFGAGTVGLAPMFYNRVDPIPTGGDVSAIQALVTDPDFKPVCATITTYAVTAQAQNFTLHIVPDNAAVRAAVAAELRDLFRREATPGGVLLISHIREAIASAAGETDHTLTTPNANIDLAADLTKISTVGSFTWT